MPGQLDTLKTLQNTPTTYEVIIWK